MGYDKYVSPTEQPIEEGAWRQLEAALADGEWQPVDLVGNEFCPTGEGGGIDPTCSPRSQGKEGRTETKHGQLEFKHPVLRAGAKDTQEAYQNEDGTWTKERQAIHKKIRDEVFKGKTPVAKPTAYLMGGGPASGKTSIIPHLGLPENRIAIAPDDFKPEFPEYVKGHPGAAAFVHEESSVLGKALQKEAATKGYNALLDGTGDSSVEDLSKRLGALRAAGQRVEGHYVTVDIETAVKRSEERAKKTGRYVPASVLRATHAAVSRTVPEAVRRGLFDSFSLWDTSGGKTVKVASAKGKNLEIHDQGAWDRFIAKGTADAHQ